MSSLPRRILASARPRSWRGWLLAAVALALFLVGAAGLLAHYRTPGRATALGISAFAPYLMLGAPLALLFLLAGRLWLPAAAALVLTAGCVATQVPLYVASSAPSDATSLTVMTFNLRLGEADPEAVVAAVRRHHVDVLMLEELTLPEQQRLIAAGLDDALPHHVSDPRAAGYGTGLWSRYALQDPLRHYDFTFAYLTASIGVPRVARPVLLAAGHMSGPWPNPFRWHLDIAHLATVLPTYAAAGSAILGGDLNSTPDETQFRALLTDGWADGAAQAGAGTTRTYPANRPFPPLIAIDHVLTHDAVATSAQTVEIPGSDHRALVVQVAVPRS